MVFPATFSMAGTDAHYQAIVSGDLSKVKTFLQVHPDALNTVRSPLPFLLFLSKAPLLTEANILSTSSTVRSSRKSVSSNLPPYAGTAALRGRVM